LGSKKLKKQLSKLQRVHTKIFQSNLLNLVCIVRRTLSSIWMQSENRLVLHK